MPLILCEGGERLLRGFDFPNRRDGFEKLSHARLDSIRKELREAGGRLEASHQARKSTGWRPWKLETPM